VFTATSFPFPPARALRFDADGYAVPSFPEFIASRSQDLPDMFHDAGQFYFGTARAFLAQQPIFAPGSLPLMLPRARVQDIDTPEDWHHAELLFRASKENRT
jgi:N-acylneuraminate cytidylyltransferase